MTLPSRGGDMEELLDQIDPESYLDREGITYKITHGSRGRQLNIKTCPFCGGSDWKVYANADTGLGICFHGSCEAKFGKFAFIRAHLGTADYGVVLRHVREVAKEMGWRPKRQSTAAVEDASGWKLPSCWPIPIDGENLLYLERRGISKELAAYFRLHYCHQGWHNFLDDAGERRGQKFDGRIIIPVYDLDGKMVTFQGRDITGASDRKYLFPARLPATGRYLYNGQNAIGAKRIAIGEGAFDVAALKIAVDLDVGLRDIVPVGTFGKHLSFGDPKGNDQIGKLIVLKSRGLEEVIFVWDGERKALEDALKASDKVREVGLRAKVALLPKGSDPNEVPPRVSAEAIWKSELVTSASKLRLMLNNPYR